MIDLELEIDKISFGIGDIIHVALKKDLELRPMYSEEESNKKVVTKVPDAERTLYAFRVTNLWDLKEGNVRIQGKMKDGYLCEFELDDCDYHQIIGYSFDEPF